MVESLSALAPNFTNCTRSRNVLSILEERGDYRTLPVLHCDKKEAIYASLAAGFN